MLAPEISNVEGLRSVSTVEGMAAERKLEAAWIPNEFGR